MPVMLLCNLDPSEGMCNGMRLIVRHLEERLIGAEIAIGDYKGHHVFIPRIFLQSSDKSRCPIAFRRHQFPLRLCFAMMINKSQGQTRYSVGDYLEQSVFSHGQLYVALSRDRSFSNVKMAAPQVYITDVIPTFTLWSVKVKVYEKMEPRQSSKTSRQYQRLILLDEKGSRVVATIYENDISALANTLLPHKTYTISNARATRVIAQYRIVDNPYQWTINFKTAIVHFCDDFILEVDSAQQFTLLVQLPNFVGNVLPVVIDKQPRRMVVANGRAMAVQDFGIIVQDFIDSFGAKIKVDAQNMPVVQFNRFIVNTYYGISLGSTSNSGVILNPIIPDAVYLSKWTREHIETLREMVASCSYFSVPRVLSPAINSGPLSVSALVKCAQGSKKRVPANLRIRGTDQRCFYMSCNKCLSSTTTEIGCDFDCLRCQELVTAMPRAKLSVLLFDDNTEVEAIAFEDVAEKMLGYSAAECFKYYKMEDNSYLALVNGALSKSLHILSVKKKSIFRRGHEEDQFTILDFESSTNVDGVGSLIRKRPLYAIDRAPQAQERMLPNGLLIVMLMQEMMAMILNRIR